MDLSSSITKYKKKNENTEARDLEEPSGPRFNKMWKKISEAGAFLNLFCQGVTDDDCEEIGPALAVPFFLFSFSVFEMFLDLLCVTGALR